MGTWIAEAHGYTDSGDAVDASALTIAAGDILFIRASAAYGSPTGIAAVGGGNVATLRTIIQNDRFVQFADVLNCDANASAVMRFSLSGWSARVTLDVYQYRPSAGESVAFSDLVGDGQYGSAPSSGTLSTVTADSIVFGAFTADSDDGYSDLQIGGVAPDDGIDSAWGPSWRKSFTSIQTDIAATAALPWGMEWVCAEAVYSVTTSGGGAELEGAISADSATSAILTVGKLLAGSVSSESAQSAAPTVAKPLSGTAPAASAVSASLSVAKGLVGSVAAAAASAGSLLVGKLLSGAASSLSALSGALESGASLAGGSAASSSASGALSVSKLLSAAASAISVIAASLQVGDSLYGSASAVSTAAAHLSTTPLYGAVPISLGEFTLEGPVIVFDGSSPSLAFSFEPEAIAFGEGV